jgi:outer membrane protein TolC
MDQVDDMTRKVILAAEGLGPQLNLTGKTNDITSPEGTDFSRLQFHRGKYEMFYDADLPLDRKNQRNDYRVALIELERQQRNYDDYMDKVELEVRDAHRKLQQEAKSYRTQQTALDLARKRVDVSPLLWEAGRLNTRDFLESQDALLEAQNKVTAALVSHLVAKLNFFRDVGVLQVRPDGMWEQRIQ